MLENNSILTQSEARELFDYLDGKLIWRNKTYSTANNTVIGREAGHIGRDGYRYIQVNNKQYSTHRIVFLYHYGYFPENETDHIDRDKANNRIENLREVTRECNVRNRKIFSNNTSGVPGVYWSKRTNNWASQIRVRGKCIHLGFHSEFSEAVAHRLAAEQAEDWPGCYGETPAYSHMLMVTGRK